MDYSIIWTEILLGEFYMIDFLAYSKIDDNNQTVIPREIRDRFDVDENTIVEWGVGENEEPRINFRKKVTLDDVIGIVKKEDDVKGDWNIDKEVYLNE